MANFIEPMALPLNMLMVIKSGGIRVKGYLVNHKKGLRDY